MSDRKLLGIGIGGAALTALCCFTPLLVIALGALGLGAWLGWLDIVLLPLLVLFLALAAFAALRLHLRRCRP
jgi:mercuric ion transport protein